jgi:hypothetical protein
MAERKYKEKKEKKKHGRVREVVFSCVCMDAHGSVWRCVRVVRCVWKCVNIYGCVRRENEKKKKKER